MLARSLCLGVHSPSCLSPRCFQLGLAKTNLLLLNLNDDNNKQAFFQQQALRESQNLRVSQRYFSFKPQSEEEQRKAKRAMIYLEHPIWPKQFLDNLKNTHKEPTELKDKLAYWTIKIMRFNFDWMSGYSFGKMTREKWLRRIIFLETVAGVPGSIAGVLRHLEALRLMRQDHGWIYTFLGEAENESMHLQTFINLYQPSLLFRAIVFLSQGVFFNFFFASYLISPTFCHRMVGYLEEEAVKTYTHLLQMLDSKELSDWESQPAPPIAIEYWKLDKNATIRDVIAVVRADEAHHRTVNHRFADLLHDDKNPFPPKDFDEIPLIDMQYLSKNKPRKETEKQKA